MVRMEQCDELNPANTEEDRTRSVPSNLHIDGMGHEQQLELCERHQQERELSMLQLRDVKHHVCHGSL